MKKIIIKDTDWARCPICNRVWVSHYVLFGFWYIAWQAKDGRLPPANLPDKLCLDHVEEILVDGRRKGIKRTLCQDQLNEIEANGLRCPVCSNLDLQWKNELAGDPTWPSEAVWECNRCHALILLGGRFTGDDKNGELVYAFYREDLQTK